MSNTNGHSERMFALSQAELEQLGSHLNCELLFAVAHVDKEEARQFIQEGDYFVTIHGDEQDVYVVAKPRPTEEAWLKFS